MKCQMVLLGNHDQGAMFDPEGFNRPAERAIFWTRDQLETSAESKQAREQRWEFLAERPRSFREDGMLFVHGSARNPLNEYVFPEDIYNQRKMERIFALVERYCFQGHTHVPGVFIEQSPEDLYQFHSPDEIDYTYRLDVAQDARATSARSASRATATRAPATSCSTATRIRYRRVEYDIETTIAKIYAVPELENFLGDRLRDGR